MGIYGENNKVLGVDMYNLILTILLDIICCDLMIAIFLQPT